MFTKTNILLLIFLTSHLSAANIDKLPSWIDPWRDATISIGKLDSMDVSQKDGKVKKVIFFSIVGTGVLMGLPNDSLGIPVLVTAKHIFYDPILNWEPESLLLRFSWFDDRPVDKYYGIKILLKKDNKRMWFAHPDTTIDLACIPLRISKKEIQNDSAQPIPFGNFATREDFFEGASIAVLGYPGAVGPYYWSKSLIRQGIIAWLTPQKPEQNSFLVDCNLFPGNSGGPVFKIPAGMDRMGNFVLGNVAFLGIVSKGPKQLLPTFIGNKELQIITGSDTAKVVSQSFIGIGVIESSFRIRDLLTEAAKYYKR